MHHVLRTSYIYTCFMFPFVFIFMYISTVFYCFFFFNDTATTEIYTLSLHDALPISCAEPRLAGSLRTVTLGSSRRSASSVDRKSTRLNSSHVSISYAVFCLKKKK